jgi:thiamine pyrophosphokinase
MRAVVVAHGEPPRRLAPADAAGGPDLVIAADGGARTCLALGLTPDVVIGDLDSLAPAEQAALQAAGTQILPYPARKDRTDLELALQLAAERGAAEAWIYGAFGRRWDHTVANLLVGFAPRLAGLRLTYADGRQTLRPLSGPDRWEIAGRPGDTVSLIPVAGDAQGVSTEGLEYPLRDETLAFGATRGVSNVLVAERAAVQLRAGRLVGIQRARPAPLRPGAAPEGDTPP